MEHSPKGHFTPAITQERVEDNLGWQREDEALADRGNGDDRGGWKQLETGKINMKLCCED